MRIQNISFTESDEHPHCLVQGDGTGDSAEMEQRALQLLADALAAGYFCVAGVINYSGYGLYLVPAARGILFVIEEFGVGSQAGVDPEGIYVEIEEANQLNPLIPYFADSAGLKAKFSNPVDEEVLNVLEQNLCSFEAMIDEDEGDIRSYIIKNNGIHLWWDQ